MVDWAQELLGDHVEADAIVETGHCLPDAAHSLHLRQRLDEGSGLGQVCSVSL
ncbi:MAG: hypothetical protein HY787_25940 [Deltaproteobacteria bacterium]|nr:hypothetical protein [Deltaproteobacteria bacterium]